MQKNKQITTATAPSKGPQFKKNEQLTQAATKGKKLLKEKPKDPIDVWIRGLRSGRWRKVVGDLQIGDKVCVMGAGWLALQDHQPRRARRWLRAKKIKGEKELTQAGIPKEYWDDEGWGNEDPIFEIDEESISSLIGLNAYGADYGELVEANDDGDIDGSVSFKKLASKIEIMTRRSKSNAKTKAK